MSVAATSTSPVWQAVAEMERQFYTRHEIAVTLREVAANIDESNGT